MIVTSDTVKIACLKDIMDNYDLFAGKYISYKDNSWTLDENANYYLKPKLFNTLDENIRLFNYRYTAYSGKRCYYIDIDLYNKLFNYDVFLKELMVLAKDKSFKNLQSACDYFVNNDYSCIICTIRFPLGIQGRFDDVKALAIRGRGEHFGRSVFLPYYGFVGNVLQKDKIFKNLIRIYILLYRPDLNYPYVFEGDKTGFNKVIDKLYQDICEDNKNE